MNELRWIILLMGALSVVGVLWWSRREFMRKQTQVQQSPDADVSPTLAPMELDSLSATQSSIEPSFGELSTSPKKEPSVSSVQASSTPSSSNQNQEEKIVCMTVRAPAHAPWQGADVLEALEREGLKYGLYDVFHRFATVPDGMNPAATMPLFTVANMQKPGDLNPKSLRESQLAGLVLFITVNETNHAIRAFTDMLSTARRLSTVLEGQVFDEQGSVMTRQLASHLRDDIIAFQHRLRLSA